MDYYKIGQRIRAFRKAAHLSQEELAEIVGISVTHMSHIETGNTKLSLSVFAALAEALNVRTDALLYDTSPTDADDLSRAASALFSSCSLQEGHILLDTVQALKAAMDKYH